MVNKTVLANENGKQNKHVEERCNENGKLILAKRWTSVEAVVFSTRVGNETKTPTKNETKNKTKPKGRLNSLEVEPCMFFASGTDSQRSPTAVGFMLAVSQLIVPHLLYSVRQTATEVMASIFWNCTASWMS